ncbi:MAG: amidohydrolase family protein [Deltaproteobacteria bacterium]|nr:amidohydrolase family protein [Deltaproteobacteria bacterium]MBW2495684.1 amidohydrolase family protein [Deltaproteobacteria bacterium]
MLIRNAEVEGRRVDVRCEAGRIHAIDARLEARNGEEQLDGEGGALLPGLHDHHLHLRALAAAQDSIPCGPPVVRSRAALQGRLASALPAADGWLRGTGYHESVAGTLDRRTLDALRVDCPMRIQHRSGSMWMLNSRGLEVLRLETSPVPPGCERDADGALTGRLFRLDAWLRERLPSGTEPDLARVGRLLARVGVTGLTEATPTNDPEEADRLREAQRSGALPQRVLLMGGALLGGMQRNERLELGARKILLDEPALPDLGELVGWIREAHASHRPVAIHTVTRTELLFALAALDEARTRPGDRLEHASVAPAETLARIATLGLTIVTQPNFVLERGDAYLADVEPRDRPLLYRLASWRQAGVSLGGGTDAPFGEADPWRAMRAAVERRTRDGRSLGPEEALSPEAALALFTTPPQAPGGAPRRVVVGARADLCLLDLPWSEARSRLERERVRATLVDGIPLPLTREP